jgi:hypothetical protein
MAKRITTIRWTVEKAASEFQIDRRTLTKRINGADIRPGKDGRFSTEQICSAVFGDYRREQLREMRARADKLEIENQCIRKERVPICDVIAVNNEVDMAIVGIIKTSKLPIGAVNEILDQIRMVGEQLVDGPVEEFKKTIGDKAAVNDRGYEEARAAADKWHADIDAAIAEPRG